MLIPVLVGGFLLWRFFVNKNNPSVLTPERQAIYNMAMSFTQDPTKLHALATAYEKVGHTTQANALRKRASLPTLPENIKAARQRAFKTALGSSDPDAINSLADVFESEGMGRSAGMLRDYAAGLDAADGVRPVKLPPMPQQGATSPPSVTPPNAQGMVNPASQVPPTTVGPLVGPPLPAESHEQAVPPPPNMNGEFGIGTVIPSQGGPQGPVSPDGPPPPIQSMPGYPFGPD